MRVISTIISFFAAWLIIATPVMACCVTGHLDQGSNSASAELSSLPPCHQGQALDTQADDTDHQMPEKFCPSCDDCAFSPPDHGESVQAITASTDLDVIAITQISANIIPADLGLPDSTAPPRRRSLPVDKPLFATDSLLI
ncbi:MAG: hypothetical protein ACPGVT_01065 [Maricaulaceae bacterium]